MKRITDRRIVAVLLLLFVVMLVFNFMTPLVGDDFAHYYGAEDRHFSSLGDMFTGMKFLRTNLNGRVVSHFFVFLFLCLPKAVFNFINAAVAAAIPYIMLRYFGKEETERRNLFLLCSGIVMMWVFQPAFGQTFLWLTGSCNYSWGLLLDLLLIYPFFCSYMGKRCFALDGGAAGKLLLVLLALAVGAYSENGASGTVCACGLFWLLSWKKNRKCDAFLAAVLAVSLAGFCFLMLSPSELSGRTADGSVSLLKRIAAVVETVKGSCICLLAVYSALVFAAAASAVDRKTIAASAVLVLSGLVSTAVFAFAAYFPERSMMILVAFVILAVLILASELCNECCGRYLLTAAAGALAAVFIFSFITGFGGIASLWMQSRARAEAIAAARSTGSPARLKPYASSTAYAAASYEELSADEDNWYTDILEHYYGVEILVDEGD